jgi:hypothetical protein
VPDQRPEQRRACFCIVLLEAVLSKRTRGETGPVDLGGWGRESAHGERRGGGVAAAAAAAAAAAPASDDDDGANSVTASDDGRAHAPTTTMTSEKKSRYGTAWTDTGRRSARASSAVEPGR